MEISSIKRFGASLLTVSLASLSLLSPIAEASTKVKLNSDSNIYITADQAQNERNSAGIYKAGEYFIYKRFGNAVNITKTEGVAGGWVKNSSLATTTSEKKETKASVVSSTTSVPSVSNNTSAERVSGDKVKLNNSVKVYLTAGDAVAKRNARSTYLAGEYHIFRTFNGAINISRFPGAPGGWISLSEVAPAASNRSATTTPAQTKKSTNTTATTSKTTTTKKAATVTTPKVDESKYTVKNNVSGFYNAADAKNGNNPVNTISAGEYFIYKKYDGMINVSKSKNSAGAWINPNHTSVVKKAVAKPATTTTTTQAPVQSSSRGQQIVNIARQYIGSRYVYGGTTPAGFDCSGFVQYVYRQAGISIPRVTYSQVNAGTRVSRANLQAGDLVFFTGNSHVGIYDGNGNVIHASTPSTGVIVSSMSTNWYTYNYAGATRVLR